MTAAAPIRSLAPPRPIRLGAVSYLNTVPLTEGLDVCADIDLTRAAPSRLLDMLESGRVDAALAPVIDAQRSESELTLIPAGMIGCDGPTMTVRLYSAIPIDRVRTVHADVESHTSAALVRIVLRRAHGADPEIVPFDARERVAASGGAGVEWPETVLMIGDKVVTDSPPAVRYPHALDLGEAWKALTGLPFVYAVWMCRRADEADPRVRTAAALLDRQRRHNATRLDWIVTERAPERKWPADLAREYLGDRLRYGVGEREREAVERFYDACAELGITPARRPTRWLEG